MVVDLEEEWDNFNKSINIEEQVLELQMLQHKIALENTVEETVNELEVEHTPVTPTSKVILKIE